MIWTRRRTLGRLLAEGRDGEATQLLTRENRRRRDAEIERQLVDLRIKAAADCLARDDPPPWPDTVPDLFPGEILPEVSVANFDVETLRSAIVHHAGLLVRGLLSENQVARVHGDIDRAFAAYDDLERGKALDAKLAGAFSESEDTKGVRREVKRKRGAIMTVDSPSTLFDVLEVFDETGVTALVEDYLGEEPVALAKKSTLRRMPCTANTGGWHQDGAFMGRDIRSLNFWVALVRCGDVAPGVDLFGQPLHDIIPSGEGAYAKWGVRAADAEKLIGDDLVRPVFDPGDAMIFDHLCLHRTAVAPDMTETRYSYETWFMGPSTYGAMIGETDEGYQPRDQVPFLV